MFGTAINYIIDIINKGYGKREQKEKVMGNKRTNFSTKNLVGYITDKEIDRPGFELYAVTDGKYIYKKKEQ